MTRAHATAAVSQPAVMATTAKAAAPTTTGPATATNRSTWPATIAATTASTAAKPVARAETATALETYRALDMAFWLAPTQEALARLS